MAKRTTPPVPEPDEINESLIVLAEMLLSDYFFDPDKELLYKRTLSAQRPAGAGGVVLDQETIELPNGDCDLRIEALRTWTQFRVGLLHPAFAATVEGTWSFESEELSQTRIARTGDKAIIEAAVEAIIDEIEGDGLDGDDFAGLMASLNGDDDEEMPLIGDDPAEPPAATAADRARAKAIAKRVARKPESEIDVEDRDWLEQTPQLLPAITGALVDLVRATKRDEPMIMAYQLLLALELEFVRYRQDRGWDWADDMLETYQERLILLGRDKTIPRDDWYLMCAALSEARIPVGESARAALADAGFDMDTSDGPPEHMMEMLREFMDELAGMASTPFEVVHSLQSAGAMMPSTLRQFLAMELALSPHAVLRDAVPLMLLDDDETVRRGAAAALEQTARPETMSPDSLRRAIAVRNWVPVADRPPLDAAIRKARLAGVEIGPWPAPIPGLEFHASTIDGSGAQSILVVSRAGKKGFLGGVLLRHGTGVVDTWADPDLTRGKITKLLREAQMSAPHARVDKTFLDMMVQDAIATAIGNEGVPPIMLLETAEFLGGAEWKDRRIDISAESGRLFNTLDPADRTPEGIDAGLARGMNWMAHDEVFGTWFEDGPQIQQALAKLPRNDQSGMMGWLLSDILTRNRGIWAERFLMMAIWAQAAGEPKQQVKARDLVLVAHALVGDRPVTEIPVMSIIAAQTVRAALLGGW
jgi:hypothetical protein